MTHWVTKYSENVLSVNTPKSPVDIINFFDIRMGLFTSAKFLSRTTLPADGRWAKLAMGEVTLWTLEGTADSSGRRPGASGWGPFWRRVL